jgi:hypothetical protein
MDKDGNCADLPITLEPYPMEKAKSDGFTKVILGKYNGYNYSVTIKDASGTKTEYFTFTPEEKVTHAQTLDNENFEDVEYEIQSAIEQRANIFYNQQISKAQ